MERLALSDAPATMRMTSCPGNTGHSRLVGADYAGAEPYPVSVVALDDWLRDNPVGPVSVCKIDTEGAEFRVLLGMARLLDREGPAVVVELIDEHLAGFGASGQMVRELLKGHGYADVTRRYALARRPQQLLREDAGRLTRNRSRGARPIAAPEAAPPGGLRWCRGTSPGGGRRPRSP